MFGAHEAQIRLAHWQRTLPVKVAVTGRAPVTRAAFLAVVRAELLPFITFGPTYQRFVAEEFVRALDMFNRGWGEEFVYWLGEALRAGVKARNVEPFDEGAVHVTATAWGISYSHRSDIDGVALSVYDFDEAAPNNCGGVGRSFRHPVYDGLRFDSDAAAREFAYNAGLVMRYAPRAVATPA
ncbi:hypothetical protein [Streptomyces europaeiscabiei]|uniref:hypothetical protein n=1 Tax=Streptomyces europaeiscabiei TaxID=146819 RepID=UPI0029BE9645|nr:hypothetical protein [Streptomyces europaeiscabiei]MDX3672747.1 hypothetical protein [Streptomyces europaeiscabiei]